MHKKLIIIPVLFVFFRLCAQNLIPDSGFESGEWKGNFRSGQGKIEISTKNPHSGKQCMTLSGISSDAKGQIFSGDIPVTADSRYLFDCFYRLDGNGVIQVRYTAGDVLCGYVFSVKPTGGSWRSLVLALKEKSAACIFYPAGLGKSERTTMDNTILSFPQGVTGININISISGISFLAVDDLSLSEIKETALGKTSGTLAAEDEEEMKRLLIKKGDPIQDEMRDPSIKLIIRDVDLPVKYETVQEQFPESATNLRVRGNCFYRGNKPVFLLGVEQTLNYYPWLCNLLGMDFSHINDLYPEASARIKQESSTYEVYWEPYNMLEPVIKRLLRSGIAACPQIIESGTSLAPLKKVCPDLYANCSHFFAFRHDMPEGRRLRENTWKSFTGITRRYPVFAYELFNEVRYMDYSPDNTTGFKKAMMQKYKNIQAANSAWGTLFASFETLEIPRKSSSYNGTEQGIKPADFSRMLFRDWTVFNETVFSEVQASQNRLIKNLDRRLPLYTTCQSVCDLSRGKSGSDGVDPVLKNRHEDIFGLEPGTGQAYYPQYGRGNYEEIRRMLLGPLVYDIARAIAGNKPVWHLEQTVSGAANLYSADSLLTDLSGKWNFADDRDKSGEKKGWHKKEFSDKNWESVTVPGMWGPQGYSNCTTGWYRRRFIPDKKISSERLFLNGEQLTDRARIFINDILVHETKSWSERFGVDITPHVRFGEENIIAVEIENNYFNAGFYWGGIRVGISIDSRNYGEVQPLTAAQMRSWLWEKAVHGNSGIMMSYFYGGEASGAGPLFSPLTHSLASIQIIPRVREEINSLADIVLEQPYCRSRIALLYSLESGRYRIYKDSTEWMKSAALYDLADFYAALVFSRISPDVIPNETLLSDDLSAYRCLILRMSERVKPGTLERITEYVKKGGILIIDHGSLAVNDEYNTRLDLSELAGISIGDALGEIRSVSLSGSTGIKTVARSSDGATGRNISLRSAKAAAVFTGTDSPAISLNRVGSGKVYYLAAEFSPDALRSVFGSILGENAISENLPVDKTAPYVETGVFTKGNDRVLYLHNWGGDAKTVFRYPAAPDGLFTLRDAESGQPFAGKKEWSSQDFKNGIAVTLSAHSPLVLLMQPAQASQRIFSRLSSAHEKKLELLHHSPQNRIRVLVSAAKAEQMTKVRMLTAVQMLENNGFEINTLLDAPKTEMTVCTDHILREKLDSYKIFITLGSCIGDRKWKQEEVNLIKKFVENGGSLLVSANLAVGPHGWTANRSGKGVLLKEFGIELSEVNIKNASDYIIEFPLFGAFNVSEKHPITTGVKRFQSLGMSVLSAQNSPAVPLILSGASCEPADAPVMMALEYGKGRIVVMGDSQWLQPEIMAMGDNAQLCLNIFKWLAREENSIRVLAKEKIIEYTDYSIK